VPEVLLQFDGAVAGGDGRAYVARVCGRETGNGLWEGWIEFDPGDGTAVLRTPRETEQPNRRDLEYWATGLTRAYLEGALARARDPHLPDPGPRTVAARPVYDGPASPGAGSAPGRLRPRGVLNPLEVYAQGERVLRQELGALDEGHLRDIVRAYALVDEDEVELAAMRRPALVDLIVAAVRRRVG
jgi:hypothetical protein